MIELLMLVLGFGLLILGAHWLVSGGTALGRRFNVPDLVIGLTIVSIGTSAPEMVVSIMASARGSTDLSITNVIGSNIFNTLVIIGVAAIIFPIRVSKNTVRFELLFSFLVALLLILFGRDIIYTGGTRMALVRFDGFLLIIGFAGFLYYNYRITVKHQEMNISQPPSLSALLTVVMVLLGLVGLYFGGHFSVKGATGLASLLGIPEKVIGITIVAVGTSLPELITSAVAAYRRNSDIAIGNALGSNIFNVLLILGVSSVIRPLPVHRGVLPDVWFAVWVNVLLALIILFPLTWRFSIGKLKGYLLVFIYVAYIFFNYSGL